MPQPKLPPQSLINIALAVDDKEPKVIKEKETEVRRVYHYVVTAKDILEQKQKVPGKYIPIVLVTGKERNIEGKDYIRGLIRDAKDPQKMVNYWNTSAAETVALAPKAPWIGTAKQFEGYENDYAAANVENFPFLKYNPDPNAPGPPQRNHPAEPPVAIFTQIQIAEKNLNTVIGTGPDLRDVAPDASGQSIIQRLKPSELSTYPFVDNLAKAQAYGYKIINEMIPEVYDTERDVMIRRPDESETFVPINMRVEDAAKLIKDNPERYNGMDLDRLNKSMLKMGNNTIFNSIGSGRYEIVVTVGPSFSTQRQESAEKFTMLAQTYPKLWGVAGDLIVESLDVQGSDEMAARLRKTLPQGLVKPRRGEKPEQPMPPSPQAILIQKKVEAESAREKREVIRTQVELVKHKIEMIKLYKEMKEEDRGMKDQIMKILSSLYADNHPADQFLQRPGAQEEEGVDVLGLMGGGE